MSSAVQCPRKTVLIGQIVSNPSPLGETLFSLSSVRNPTESPSGEKKAPAAADPGDKPQSEKIETEELETTLNQGLQFLGGLLKMTTGKDLLTEDQSVTVNKETGEVVMKFKLPGF